jgi:hypothetical protein
LTLGTDFVIFVLLELCLLTLDEKAPPRLKLLFWVVRRIYQ